MPVPNSTSEYLVNTTGGAFVAQNQGGTLLGNETTGSVITKAFPIKDAVDDDHRIPVASEQANFGATRIVSGAQVGTRTYPNGLFNSINAGFYNMNFLVRQDSGYGIGVTSESSKKFQLPIRGESYRSILEFKHDFGAEIAKYFFQGRYSFTGRDRAGTKYKRRSAALFTNLANNGIQSGGPARTTTYMYDIADGDANNQAVDSAATPTRAIPGELVMKVDFVTTNVSTGGDFFDYKPITGM